MTFHHGMGRLARQTDEKPAITWPLLRRVLAYALPYRWQIIGMLLLILASTGLSLAVPLILRDLIDRAIPAQDTRRLLTLAGALLLIPALNGAMSVAQRRLNASVGEGVIYDLRVALYANLQRMSLRFFTRTRLGELISRMNSDVVGAQTAISNTLASMLTEFIQAAAVLGVMFTLEWRLTLISILILPLFIVAMRKLGDRLRDTARRQMEANAHMNATMNETLNIGGALLIKLFGRAELEVGRFSQRAGRVRDLGVTRAVTGSTFFAIIGLLSAVGTALVYGLGGLFAMRGEFTVGTIVAFGTYMGSLYAALRNLANAPVEFATSLVSFERVFEVIDLPGDINEKEGALDLGETRGELEFRHVSFIYQDGAERLLKDVQRYGSTDQVEAVLSGGEGGLRPLAEEPSLEEGKEREENEDERMARSQAREYALEDVSFRAEPGQLVALVGPSGAGKTTLTYLIPRLYDPQAGSIHIDGHDLRDLTLHSLSKQIGMVTQETYLFHDTIRTNLLYARLKAGQAEIEEACRVANIHDFIRELPEGYDTIVGERGYRLSGGEKQRIALARVILKDPCLLVLDEATSSLDSESEALIQDALKRVMRRRTCIVIAHRLSTILAADLILVMDRGRIVERGAHAELLRQGGLYAHLYETQFSQGETAAA